MHDYEPAGIVSFSAGENNIHLVWCFNQAGHEVLGVANIPSDFPMDQLRATLYRSVKAAPVKSLFPCKGVLNRERLQCTGPFAVDITGDGDELYVVNGTFPTGTRAFLIVAARNREHAIAPIEALHKCGSGQQGVKTLTSSGIRFIAEFENIDPECQYGLNPQNDFEFIAAKSD